MEWIELIVHTTTEGSDSVSEILMEAGATGTMVEDRADIPDPDKPHGIWEIIDSKLLDNMPEDVLVHAWYEPNASFAAVLEKIKGDLDRLSSDSHLVGSLQIETKSVNDRSWAEVWKQFYKPFYAGKHLVIKPSWEPFNPKQDDLVLEIDPGMAFGSGTHETTSMCLEILEQLIKGGEEVIDVGTGSGILAIGAALFGAGHVLATDIDPDAVRVAAENVEHNHVSKIVSVRHCNLLDQVDSICDICVVNIISDVMISFAAPLTRYIRPGGYLISSGIVLQRNDEVAQALTKAGYTIIEKHVKGDWTAFLSRRNDDAQVFSGS